MGMPVLVRCHLNIEMSPSLMNTRDKFVINTAPAEGLVRLAARASADTVMDIYTWDQHLKVCFIYTHKLWVNIERCSIREEGLFHSFYRMEDFSENTSTSSSYDFACTPTIMLSWEVKNIVVWTNKLFSNNNTSSYCYHAVIDREIFCDTCLRFLPDPGRTHPGLIGSLCTSAMYTNRSDWCDSVTTSDTVTPIRSICAHGTLLK